MKQLGPAEPACGSAEMLTRLYYTTSMEIHLKPELEDKLNQIAAQSGRGAGQIVEELVETYVDHDQWFRQQIDRGLAQLNRDEIIEHDEVMAKVERI